MKGTEVNVLNCGFVRLDDYMADDLSVVNSARVSFNKRVENLCGSDEKLIGFLMKNRHGTPFESNSMRWHIKAPIFVFREWQRHRIASYNEWSARYSELKEEFYIPCQKNVRSQVGKPGHYKFEQIEDVKANNFIYELETSSKECFSQYSWAIQNGIAKELARLFLPVNIYSEMYFTVNARSLMNFLNLRNSDKAMWEICQYAQVIEDIWSKLMPITHKYFIENNRVAP